MAASASTAAAWDPAWADALRTLTVEAVDGPATAWAGDLLALAVFEDDFSPDGTLVPAAAAAAAALGGGVLADIIKDADFKAGAGKSAWGLARAGGAKWVGVVGLGKRAVAATAGDRKAATAWKAAGNALGAACRSHKCASAAVTLPTLPSALAESLGHGLASSLTIGACAGAYEESRFKSKPKPCALRSLALLGLSRPAASAVPSGVESGKAVALGIVLARQLVAAPPNVASPAAMAAAAAHLAAESGGALTLTVLGRAECAALGMGAYLGVSEASDCPPQFIHLVYHPPAGGPPPVRVAVIGKGLTFDSGGYNLKTGAGSMIELMKFDMGGAAATLGAARAVAMLRPSGVEAHFLVAACENMVGSRGMRPGDILTASNGKTIEVNNTDAEGRLTLADALVYAEKLGATRVVDVATLTGACMIALGTAIAGLFTESEVAAAALEAASAAGGEKLWRLPMEESYREQLDSNIADMKNSATGKGGAITAALFLKEFVGPGIKEWAHIDLAGPVWDDKVSGGGTGYGVATLTHWVVNQRSAERG